MKRTAEEEIAVALVAVPEVIELRRRASLLGLAVVDAASTTAVVPPVPLAPPVEPPKPARPAVEAILIDAPEAAALLGISVDALWMRVSRRQVMGIVRTGRRTQFHRKRLLEALDRKVTR